MLARLSLIFCLSLPAGAIAAQANDVESVLLRHRPVDQVLPALRPLVDPGGVVSGMADQLIIRSNPRNREQLKAALRSIDVPMRRLMVSLQRGSDPGEPSGGARANVNGRTYASRAATDDGIVQQVQTVDGVAAFIASEQSVPLQQESIVPTPGGHGVMQSTILRNAANGFSVMPRTVGDRVIIEVQSKRESLSGQGSGTIDADRINATVTGRLGEWIRLGGGTVRSARVISSAAAPEAEQRPFG
ncbi:MAG: hypothetical protein EXR39_15050 [Betaproteobacteria bacterium]|nr:hypothetical protein [Betaproteobacteria bacterium]